MRVLSKIAAGSLFLLLTGSIAVAGGESENQDKMQEDLDSYKARIVENCGTTDKLSIKWNGKLGSNPREVQKGDYSSVGTLCQSALDATSNVCQSNRVVKKAFGKLTSITCQKGTGPIGYKFKGARLSFTVDTKYDKNNAAGQQSDLEEKLKVDLDK